MTSAPPIDPDVLARVLADPAELLQAAAEGGPGWSEPYGGQTGVAYLAGLIQQQLADQTRLVAELRSAAIGALLHDRSLATVGKALGVSRQSVHKAFKALGSANSFAALATLERQW